MAVFHRQKHSLSLGELEIPSPTKKKIKNCFLSTSDQRCPAKTPVTHIFLSHTANFLTSLLTFSSRCFAHRPVSPTGIQRRLRYPEAPRRPPGSWAALGGPPAPLAQRGLPPVPDPPAAAGPQRAAPRPEPQPQFAAPLQEPQRGPQQGGCHLLLSLSQQPE